MRQDATSSYYWRRYERGDKGWCDVIVSLTILGKPVGKERPRVTKNGTYTPKKTKDYAKKTGWAYKEKYGGSISFEPKKKIYMGMLVFFANDTRPDLNNVERLVTDALEKVAYDNDKVVACSYKDYDYDEENPRVEIVLSDERFVDRSLFRYYFDYEQHQLQD